MPNLRALRDMVEAQVEPRISRRPATRPSPAAACSQDTYDNNRSGKVRSNSRVELSGAVDAAERLVQRMSILAHS